MVLLADVCAAMEWKDNCSLLKPRSFFYSVGLVSVGSDHIVLIKAIAETWENGDIALMK